MQAWARAPALLGVVAARVGGEGACRARPGSVGGPRIDMLAGRHQSGLSAGDGQHGLHVSVIHRADDEGGRAQRPALASVLGRVEPERLPLGVHRIEAAGVVGSKRSTEPARDAPVAVGVRAVAGSGHHQHGALAAAVHGGGGLQQEVDRRADGVLAHRALLPPYRASVGRASPAVERAWLRELRGPAQAQVDHKRMAGRCWTSGVGSELPPPGRPPHGRQGDVGLTLGVQRMVQRPGQQVGRGLAVLIEDAVAAQREPPVGGELTGEQRHVGAMLVHALALERRASVHFTSHQPRAAVLRHQARVDERQLHLRVAVSQAGVTHRHALQVPLQDVAVIAGLGLHTLRPEGAHPPYPDLLEHGAHRPVVSLVAQGLSVGAGRGVAQRTHHLAEHRLTHGELLGGLGPVAAEGGIGRGRAQGIGAHILGAREEPGVPIRGVDPVGEATGQRGGELWTGSPQRRVVIALTDRGDAGEVDEEEVGAAHPEQVWPDGLAVVVHARRRRLGSHGAIGALGQLEGHLEEAVAAPRTPARAGAVLQHGRGPHLDQLAGDGSSGGRGHGAHRLVKGGGQRLRGYWTAADGAQRQQGQAGCRRDGTRAPQCTPPFHHSSCPPPAGAVVITLERPIRRNAVQTSRPAARAWRVALRRAAVGSVAPEAA